MKRTQLAAALIILFIAVVPLPAHQAGGTPSAYAEKLTLYVAGSNALWFLRFDGVNVTNPQIAAAESIQGLNWYNVTAIDTSSWASDFQVFGPSGYGLLPVPFVPTQGLFLTVGASSFAAASEAANAFDSLLFSAFTSYSNRSGVYVFYSPLSFRQIVPATLMKFYPRSAGGFASLLSSSDFASLSAPAVMLSGVRSGSVFSHSLIVSSIKSGALDTTNKPALLTLFGSGKSYIQASNVSSSSVISIHVLDGLVSSQDKADVSDNAGSFTGSYTLALPHGRKLHSINATVLQQPVLVVASRQFDNGVLKPGQTVAVTISVRDITNGTTASNFTLSDDWWKSYGFFMLVNGSSDIKITTLNAQQTLTPTYVLRYTGNVSEQILVPPGSATYSYNYGTASYTGTTTLNSAVLFVGVDQPSVVASASPSGGSGNPIGFKQDMVVTVKNVGTRTALGVTVAGQEVGNLLAGDSSTVRIPLRASSLVNGNVTETLPVSYGTPDGQTVRLSTNRVSLLFSHTSMELGISRLTLNGTISQLGQDRTNLTLTLTTHAIGGAGVDSLSASLPLPRELGCGKVVGANATCSAGLLTARYSSLKPGATQKVSLEYNVTSPRNFILQPGRFSFQSSGFNLTSFTNGLALPTGVVISKSYFPNPLFSGMGALVRVSTLNLGPFNLYNTTVNGGADSFDSVPPTSGGIQAFNSTIQSGGNFTYSYTVVMGTTPGNMTSSPASSSFYFGGQKFQVSQLQQKVTVYQPLSVSITVVPSQPVENRPFSMIVTLYNRAGVSVNSVEFFLNLPSGVTVISSSNAKYTAGRLSISLPGMAPHSTYTANVTATATSGVAIDYTKSGLTFRYAGAQIKGTTPGQGVVIGEDVTTRYLIPITLVLLGVLATALVVRRRVFVTSPSSQI